MVRDIKRCQKIIARGQATKKPTKTFARWPETSLAKAAADTPSGPGDISTSISTSFKWLEDLWKSFRSQFRTQLDEGPPGEQEMAHVDCFFRVRMRGSSDSVCVSAPLAHQVVLAALSLILQCFLHAIPDFRAAMTWQCFVAVASSSVPDSRHRASCYVCA